MSRPTTGLDFFVRPNTARPHPQSRYQPRSHTRLRRIFNDLTEFAVGVDAPIAPAVTIPSVDDRIAGRPALAFPAPLIGQYGSHLDSAPKRSYHQGLSLSDSTPQGRATPNTTVSYGERDFGNAYVH